MSRTDFEAAYIEHYGHRPRGWNDDFQVYQDAHANGAWFGWQAGAAGIEAKAAPVGEQEAAIALMNDAVLNGGWNNVREMGIHMFQAGAAFQRQVHAEHEGPDYGDGSEFEGWAERSGQQSQSVEAVAFQKPSVLKDCNVRYSTSTTPQPSAGVVMPERKTAMSGDVLSFQSEGWNACLDEFARLNGKEVGRE